MRCLIWGLDLTERLTDEKNMSEKSGTIIRRDEARALHAFGEEVRILLDGRGDRRKAYDVDGDHAARRRAAATSSRE